jgi:hypothetical protein
MMSTLNSITEAATALAGGYAFWLRDLWHARARLKAAVAKIKPAPREPKERATAA